MTGYSSTQLNDSSAPLLSGMFAFVGHFEQVINNYHAAISTAIDHVSTAEQAMIRDKARQSDTGWAPLADKIQVQYSPEERMLKYSVATEDIKENNKALSLEFGDGDRPPSPLLRSSAHASKENFGPKVTDKAYELLNGGY